MKKTQSFFVPVLSTALFACTCALPAFAQDYPTKPIRMIVPYPPAGGTDIVARVVNEPLSSVLGQPIVIDNKGGAAGNLGTELAAKAPPDGYTILFTLSSHTINPKLYGKLPFDVEKDFAAVSLAAYIPQILIAHPSLPVNNIHELIAYAKARPGKLNYASVGVGSPAHIAGELFKLKSGVDMVHVPYKGGGPAVSDTIGGQVQLAFVSMPAALQHVKSGRLKALGIASDKRSIAAPDIPTLAESGLPGFELVAWQGIVAPAGTPRGIIDELAGQIGKLLADPVTRERFAAVALEPIAGSTPDSFAVYIKTEVDRWEAIVRNSGIELE